MNTVTTCCSVLLAMTLTATGATSSGDAYSGEEITAKLKTLRPDDSDFRFVAPQGWGPNLALRAAIHDVTPSRQVDSPQTMVDGEASTTWTCQAPEARATFTIDLGASRRFDRLVVFNRQTDQRGTGGGNNALKRFTLHAAEEDSPEQYMTIGEYSLEGPAAVCFKRKSGGQVCAFIDRKEPNLVALQVTEARYVKFEVEEAFWGEAAQETWRSSVAISEVMIFDSHAIGSTEAAGTSAQVTPAARD